MATRLEDVVEADEVGVDVRLRVVDRVAHPRLRGEVHDDVEVVLREEALDEGGVAEVTPSESEAPFLIRLPEHPEPVLLDAGVVVAVHVVEPGDLPATALYEPPAQE